MAKQSNTWFIVSMILIGVLVVGGIFGLITFGNNPQTNKCITFLPDNLGMYRDRLSSTLDCSLMQGGLFCSDIYSILPIDNEFNFNSLQPAILSSQKICDVSIYEVDNIKFSNTFSNKRYIIPTQNYIIMSNTFENAEQIVSYFEAKTAN